MVRRPPAPRRHKRCCRTPLQIEALERRCVPSTITPTTFADGGLGSGSLRDAVLQFDADTGTDDDIVQLLAGTYTLTIRNVDGHHETAGLTGDLDLNQTSHRWIIQGAGSSTIIDASQLEDRAFQIVKPGTQVVFQDLVIQGGLAQDDGSDGALEGTTDALGGGILNNGGNVTLDRVVLRNDVARGGDAAVLRAPGHNASGGGFYGAGGALTMAGATLANNQAIGGRGGDYSDYLPGGEGGSGRGGGLYATGASLHIAHSRVANNQATGGQGGDGTGPPTTGTPGGPGGSGQGGGLYVSGGALMIATTPIASNQGTGGPGGAFGEGGAGQGGGVFNGGTLTLANSTIASNLGTGGTGGYGWNGGTGQGGGLYNAGTLTLRHSTTDSDQATGGPAGSGYGGSPGRGEGGGLYNGGTLALGDSTLSGNSVTGGNGGGIFTACTSPVTLMSVTLTANRTNTDGFDGGGVFIASGSPVLHNTLIAANFRGATGTIRDDVVGRLDPGGDYNLIGDGTGMSGLQNGVNGNLVGSASDPVDPLLGPLQNSGGPTKTHALLAGSPALNAGDPSQLGVPDQRGVVRSGGVNIGAYQASASAFLVNAPATVTAGVPFDVTVTAVDPFGQVAAGYSGTATFSTTDPDLGVVLPADYTFTADDGGTHTFTDTGTGEITLVTLGDQMLTVTDTADDTITGSATITVVAGGGPSAGVSGGQHSSTPPPAGTGRPPEQSLRALAADLWAVRARRQHETTPGGSAGWFTDLFWEEDRLFG
jgi:hypothetical protein